MSCVPRPTPAKRAAHPVAGAAACVRITRAEPEALARIEGLVALLVEDPASARRCAVLERAAVFPARARRGGGRQ